MSTWSNDDLPECLIGYSGQHSSTIWYKHLCEHFSKNYVVGTHYKGLKRYKSCFLASEAITWLQHELSTKKFKSTMKRDGVTKILAMMHRIHQVFEDVRGTVYDKEGFADNSRLYRFKEYCIGYDDALDEKVQNKHERQPFSELNNFTSLSKHSARKCNISNENILESIVDIKEILNSSCSGSKDKFMVSRSLCRSSSLINLDGSSSVLNLPENTSNNECIQNSSNTFLSTSCDKNMQASTTCFDKSFLPCFEDKKKEDDNGLLDFIDALELCSSDHSSHVYDNVFSDEKVVKLKPSKSFALHNKENEEVAFSKFKDNSTKSSMNGKYCDEHFEDNSKPLAFDDYKLSLIISLCKKLKVDNICKIMSVDLIDSYNVKANIKSGNKLMESFSKKDFPENICLMLKKLSNWPLKTYCTYRVGTERCNASVQSMFDAVLDYVELHPESIFPKHFFNLLVVVHDLCKIKSSKSCEENISDENMMPSSSRFSRSFSMSEKVTKKHSENLTIRNSRRYEKHDNSSIGFKSECNDDEKKLIRNHDVRMSPSYQLKFWKNPRSVTIPYIPPIKLNKSLDEDIGVLKEYSGDECLRDVSPVSRGSEFILDPLPLIRSATIDSYPAKQLTDKSADGKKRKSFFKLVNRLSPCKESWKADLAKLSTVRHPSPKEELMKAFDDTVDLPPNKTMVTKDGGAYFYREFPQLMQLPGWRSNCSTLELGRRAKRDDLIIINTAGQTIQPSTISFLSHDSHGDLLVNRNIHIEEINKHQFCEALQLCFLMLSQAQRRNFYRLFSFAEAIISNRGICTLGVVPKKDMIVEALTNVLTRSSDNGDIMEPIFIAIFNFFVDEYEKILKIPHLEPNVVSNDVNTYADVALSFCKRVTVSEFEAQSSNFTRNALVQLLKTFIEDPSLSEKDRKDHLRKFEKAYPDIFYCFFPPMILPLEAKDLKTRFVESFRKLLGNLRQ